MLRECPKQDVLLHLHAATNNRFLTEAGKQVRREWAREILKRMQEEKNVRA